MEIAIVKEIAAHGKETRAILLPREVKRLADEGHRVFTEKDLGAKIFIPDSEYESHGARVLSNRKELFRKNIVVKLKPPLPQEFKLLRNNLLFCMRSMLRLCLPAQLAMKILMWSETRVHSFFNLNNKYIFKSFL